MLLDSVYARTLVFIGILIAGMSFVSSKFSCLTHLQSVSTPQDFSILHMRLRKMLMSQAVNAERYGKPIQSAEVLCIYLQRKTKYLLSSRLDLTFNHTNSFTANKSDNNNENERDKQALMLHLYSTKFLFQETLKLRMKHCILNKKIYNNKTLACDAPNNSNNNTLKPHVTRQGLQRTTRIIMNVFGNASSVLCLVVLIAIYSKCVELKAAFPSRCIICFSIMQLALNVTELAAVREITKQQVCTTITILTHWSSVSSFAWLTCISLEQYLALSEWINLRKSERFILHMLTSFGLSAIIILICVILNFSSLGLTIYGQRRCYVINDARINFFSIILPMSVMFVANLLWSVIILRKSIKHSKFPNNVSVMEEPSMTKHRAVIAATTLLLSTEILLGRTMEVFQATNFSIEIISILLVRFYGVFVFIAFACNRKVLNAVKNQLKKRETMHKSSYKYRSSKLQKQRKSKKDSLESQFWQICTL